MKTGHLITLLFALLLLNACSGTKNLSKGEVLYVGTRQVRLNKIPYQGEDWKMSQKIDKKTNAWIDVMVSPNGAIFGLPFARFISVRLFLYNLFHTEKEKGFSRWMMENFGEPPVTIASVNPELRLKKIENDLINQGHFGTEGGYRVVYKNKKKKKAKISYFFDVPKAYTYRNFELVLDSTQKNLAPGINAYLQHSHLISGDNFDVNEISREKEALWNHLQDRGYYFIRPEDILILADSTVGNKQVDIQYRLNREMPRAAYHPLKINDIFIRQDSTELDLHSETLPVTGVKSKLLQEAVIPKDGDLYSLSSIRRTIRNLSGLGVFTDLSVSYRIRNDDSTQADALVNISPMDKISLSANTDLALKSTGFIGPSLGLTLNHRDLMGGAENFSFGVNGYLDFPTGIFRERVPPSSGFTVESSLSVPVLGSPLAFVTGSAITLPRRQITLIFEQNNRRDYFQIANWKASYTLNWKSSPAATHQLGIINLNYAHLLSRTPLFDSLLAQSRQVRESFDEQFIFGPSYTFTFDNTGLSTNRLTTYYQAEIEFSGNVLNGMYGLLAERGNGERKVLGVDYSQFVRFMSDFRLYYQLAGRDQKVVFRNVFEVGKALGNSEFMPFIKQFYIGGANSLRPLDARTTGPGRYLEFDQALVNQVGDIRIETNLEYRFHLFYKVKGALWSDFGNIWLHEDDPERPASGIRWDKILQDSYLTAGVGLRLDMDYVVARADFGAVMYAPIFSQGFRWLWQNELPLWGPSLGIGYPF
jgi:hypothetical protein